MDTRRFPGRFANSIALIMFGFLLALSSASRAGEGVQNVTLELGDYRFFPSDIEVRSGQPVVLTLTNKDSVTPHNFTLSDPEAGLDLNVRVGARASVVVEFTPQQVGTFTFYCNKKLPFMKSHRDHGMEGTLTVVKTMAE